VCVCVCVGKLFAWLAFLADQLVGCWVLLGLARVSRTLARTLAQEGRVGGWVGWWVRVWVWVCVLSAYAPRVGLRSDLVDLKN
jgi:hypothetical protein